MAGTSNVSFTIQELGNPVSVAGHYVTAALHRWATWPVLGIMLHEALSKITSVVKIEIFFATCVVNLRFKNTEDLLQI